MQKIKTVQPYKLYKKILKDRSKAKFALIGAVVVLLSSMVFDPDLGLVLVPLFLILSIPLTIYNPKLKAEYEPGVSYKYFRNYKNLQSKLPKTLVDKEERMRLENHQDVDFNVKVDLNAIYGVNDKLVMSYQNFGYEKEKMEDGDYLLGVSAQGVYYVCKNQTVTKTKINFSDIDTLGLLAGIGNVFVFHIISKQNDEINIIVDQNDSLLVSPFMLFSTLLKLLDDYIVNGGAVSNSSSRRRRVSVSPEASTETGSTMTEPQETTNNRVIDISYSTGVLEEMKTATYVGSNRNIDIDTLVATGIANEESEGSKFANLEGIESGSNRSIDLDDVIGTRVADVRRNNVIENEATPTPIVSTPQSQSEIHDSAPQEKKEIQEPDRPDEGVHNPGIPKEESREIEAPQEETHSMELHKEEHTKEEKIEGKSKTGKIIGIVAGVLAIAAFVSFFVIKGMKEKALQEQMMTDPSTYPWLHGEWRNGVYGDVLDIGYNGVKFVKNGLDHGDDMEESDSRPLTINDLCNQLPYLEEYPFQLNYAGKGNDGTPNLSLVFNYKPYYSAPEETANINLDTENRLLYYVDNNGKKIFLDKYSDQTFEEKWNQALEKANQELSEDLANHSYDWLYGTWLDEWEHPVVVTKDKVYYDSQEIPFNLHYELENPYNETMDYGLYLYLCNIRVNKDYRCLYWADEMSTYEYPKISNSTDPAPKIYSNAHEGYQVVVIDGSELRLRLGPSTSSDTFKWPDGTNRHPNVGEKFKYLGESGDFYKIDFNGKELWVSKQFTHVE